MKLQHIIWSKQSAHETLISKMILHLPLGVQVIAIPVSLVCEGSAVAPGFQ